MWEVLVLYSICHGGDQKTKEKGTVYTDAVSFVTASVSMRLPLSFTRRRSSSLSEPGRFEYAFKSGAFSKRYGFIGRVNGETASI